MTLAVLVRMAMTSYDLAEKTRQHGGCISGTPEVKWNPAACQSSNLGRVGSTHGLRSHSFQAYF